ncbi:MAG: hypothetical protein HY423_14465 [Candidatus Lambdaproteobacteria bacterium]|nr:hypothetical protein [Candidatus Lambdaproteobacteria bacterium]
MTRHLPKAFAWALALLAAQAAWASPGPESAGIVMLRITRQTFDPVYPWNKTVERRYLGNALVVEGDLLLTTADMVRGATQLTVRKFGQYPNYRAQVALIDHEVDLALLKVDDAAFWQGLHRIPISERPVEAGKFEIIRWRGNGRFQQGTGEIVDYRVTNSRLGAMEFAVLRGNTTMDSLGWSEGLTEQGQLIGLVTGANQREIQATSGQLLQLFVQAAQKSPFRGLAHRGFGWQPLNNASQRQFFGLAGMPFGVRVTRTYSGGTGAEQLEEGDILLRLGAYDIDPEGQINHPLYGPTLFTMAINDSLEPRLPAVVIRGGNRLNLTLPRTRFSEADYRIPPYSTEGAIDYEVFGGLVFQELSLDYLRSWGSQWEAQAPRRLLLELSLRMRREPDDPQQRVVIVSRVLPDPVNLGYDNVNYGMLLEVNGRSVTSLLELRRALRTPQGDYHLLRMMPGQGRQQLVFKVDQMPEANRRIRERYGIPEPLTSAADVW